MTIIERKRGDTYPMHFTIKSNNVTLDITGCGFKLTVDPRKDPPDPTLNLFTLVGVIDGPPANGLVKFDMSLTQADHIGKFFYDLQMIDAAGFIRTIEKDKFNFVQDITKATS